MFGGIWQTQIAAATSRASCGQFRVIAYAWRSVGSVAVSVASIGTLASLNDVSLQFEIASCNRRTHLQLSQSLLSRLDGRMHTAQMMLKCPLYAPIQIFRLSLKGATVCFRSRPRFHLDRVDRLLSMVLVTLLELLR
jgi:hypothetical protein